METDLNREKGNGKKILKTIKSTNDDNQKQIELNNNIEDINKSFVINSIDYEISNVLKLRSTVLQNIDKETKFVSDTISSLERQPLEGEVKINNKSVKLEELASNIVQTSKIEEAYWQSQKEILTSYFEDKRAGLEASKIRFTVDDIEKTLEEKPIWKIIGCSQKNRRRRRQRRRKRR